MANTFYNYTEMHIWQRWGRSRPEGADWWGGSWRPKIWESTLVLRGRFYHFHFLFLRLSLSLSRVSPKKLDLVQQPLEERKVWCGQLSITFTFHFSDYHFHFHFHQKYENPPWSWEVGLMWAALYHFHFLFLRFSLSLSPKIWESTLVQQPLEEREAWCGQLSRKKWGSHFRGLQSFTTLSCLSSISYCISSQYLFTKQSSSFFDFVRTGCFLIKTSFQKDARADETFWVKLFWDKNIMMEVFSHPFHPG